MKKVFLFRNVQLSSVKVSHSMVVGLPSLPGLTGLAGAFASELARACGLEPRELLSSGVLLAIDKYKLHEGYKKITERGQGSGVAHRALASAFASFNACFILEVCADSEKAADVLANQALTDTAHEVFRALKLCGAPLIDAPQPTRLSEQRVEEFGGERAAALSLLPSKSKVLVDQSPVVAFLREKGLPLAESLIAATLRHDERPPAYKAAFDEAAELMGSEFQPVYGVVNDGFMLVGDAARLSNRLSYSGKRLPLQVASPTLSLVRLQTAASLRNAPAYEDGTRPQDAAFWRMYGIQGGFICRASA